MKLCQNYIYMKIPSYIEQENIRPTKQVVFYARGKERKQVEISLGKCRYLRYKKRVCKIRN